MPLTRDDFILDVGGFLDNVPGDVTDATFEIASGKYADQVMLGGSEAKPPVVLTLTIESPDLERPAEQSFSVGSPVVWDIIDGGKGIRNIGNPDKHAFRKGSMAGALVTAMAEAIGGGDPDKGWEFFAKRGHYMTSADFYCGLAWHWEVKEIKRDIGGKQVTSRPPLPAKYLGESSKAESAPVADAGELDKLLVENASGKTDKELKSWAIRNPGIKASDTYTKAVISGSKLKELEDKGDLVKDPDTGKYL